MRPLQGAWRQLPRLAEEPQEIERGHVGIERSALRQVAEPLRGFDALLANVEPGDRRPAGAGRQEPGEHAHQCGLAGPVRPEKRDDLTLGNRERGVVDRHERPVILAEAVRLDHRGRTRRRGRRLDHLVRAHRGFLLHVDTPRRSRRRRVSVGFFRLRPLACQPSVSPVSVRRRTSITDCPDAMSSEDRDGTGHRTHSGSGGYEPRARSGRSDTTKRTQSIANPPDVHQVAAPAHRTPRVGRVLPSGPFRHRRGGAAHRVRGRTS